VEQNSERVEHSADEEQMLSHTEFTSGVLAVCVAKRRDRALSNNIPSFVANV
jgi:hypothetical protein